MRPLVIGSAVLALAACQPKIPDSAAGVGFDNAVMSPRPTVEVAAVPPARAVSEESLASPVPPPSPTRTTAAVKPKPDSTLKPLATTETARPKPAAKPPATPPATPAVTVASVPPAPSRSAPGEAQKTPDGIVHASPNNPAPVLMNNPGISDENNFEAVGSRRSIEDDAQRMANNKANYQVISPTAVPQRTNSGPNIVAFALSTRHAPGTKTYARMGLTTQSRHQKACSKYATDSEAQSAFLSKGGPKKDRLGLDPDGDGYACSWDPTPFRRAASN